MFGYDKLIDNRKKKSELRRILDKHIAEYLARGGKITKIKAGEITEGLNMHDAAFETRNEKVKLSKEKQNRELMLKNISENK